MHLDIDDIEKNDVNYKSKLLEWSQKEKHHVEFRHVGVKGEGFEKQYVIQVLIDEKEYGQSVDFSIKGAEQLAAEKTWHQMEEESQVI